MQRPSNALGEKIANVERYGANLSTGRIDSDIGYFLVERPANRDEPLERFARVAPEQQWPVPAAMRALELGIDARLQIHDYRAGLKALLAGA